MPFSKRSLSAEITLIVSAGMLLAAAPRHAVAQQPQYTCRPDASGDGWVCESSEPLPPNMSIGGSAGALLPGADESEPEDDSPQRPAIGEPAQEQRAADADSGAQPDSGQQTPPVLPFAAARAESAGTAETEIVAPVSAYPLDWVPVEAMSEEQRQAIAPNCCGGFIDPAATADPAANPDTAPTQFRALSGVSQLSEELITIDGEVIVRQGYRTMENDGQTAIDSSANTVRMEGDVVFREPGMLLQGNSAFIDNAENFNRVDGARYVLHESGAHGSAEALLYDSDSGLVTIENGELSRCEPEQQFWTLRASNILLDQERGRGYADNVSLRLGNVPIFYYPFTMPFPLGDEPISGFLAPSTGSTRSGGFDFELPYYFALAPHYDATLSPRLISDRGTLVGLETRYLASWSMNTLNMAGLSGDKLFDPTTANLPGAVSPPVEDRWFLGFEHTGAIGGNWTTFIDYNAVSDEDYFYDLGSNGLNLTSRTHLNRQGRVDYQSDYLQASLNVQRTQIIDPFIITSDINTPFDRLPQLQFNTGSYLPGGFRFALRGEVSVFDRQLDEGALSMDELERGALVNGERINLEPELSWALEYPGWFLRTTAAYRHAQYRLENQAAGTLEDPEIDIGVYSADAGLVFERAMARGAGWTQTLEPRVFYLYSEFEDQSQIPLFDTSELSFSFNQLFRNDRFSGGDRVADADQVTVALTSRLLDPAGKERARFSLGQIRYFQDRQVSLSNPLQNWPSRYSPVNMDSALVGETAFQLGDNWRLDADVQWAEEEQEVQEGTFQLRYQGEGQRLFNLAYRYRQLVDSPNFVLPPGIDTRIKQTDLSAVWPLTASWTLLGRWNYDHSNERNLESFAGIEWSNCCATIRLIGREWVDEDELFLPNIEPNRGIFVQFVLNGLGNLTGGGLSNLLTDGIRGFRDSTYEQ